MQVEKKTAAGVSTEVSVGTGTQTVKMNHSYNENSITYRINNTSIMSMLEPQTKFNYFTWTVPFLDQRYNNSITIRHSIITLRSHLTSNLQPNDA